MGFGIGRFFSAWMMRYIQPSKLMGIYCVVNTCLAALVIAFPGWIGVGALSLTSFFMSLLFPTIFALGIRGLGENTKLGSSLLIMAIIGGAVLTPIMGLISVYFNLAFAYVVPMLAFVFIAFFSFVELRRLNNGNKQRQSMFPVGAGAMRTSTSQMRDEGIRQDSSSFQCEGYDCTLSSYIDMLVNDVGMIHLT